MRIKGRGVEGREGREGGRVLTFSARRRAWLCS